jgi:hypothetical protein
VCLVEQFRDDLTIMELLICRGVLWPSFAEKLFTLVSEQFQRQLTRRYLFPWALASDAAETAREVGILKFLIPWMTRMEIEHLTRQMHRGKRLHYSLVIRALCMGEVRFFEYSMAALAGVPVENARILMQDSGGQGFSALYASCSMPTGFMEAVRALYRIALQETNSGKNRVRDFESRVIDRLTAKGYHESVENMSYFISIMRHKIHETASSPLH